MPERTTAVPTFETFVELDEGLSCKGTGAAIDLYPRDGTVALYNAEQQIARLTGVNPDHVVLQNTGMTAINDALEVAVGESGTTSPKIAVAYEAYAKTGKCVRSYAKRHGLERVDFDSGDVDDVAFVIENDQPDIIIVETVANGGSMPVLNHEHLLATVRRQEKPPIVILDHTLPLTSGYDVFSELTEDDKVVVVESATKSYALNSEVGGITFCKNKQLLEAIREFRTDRGSGSGVGSIALIGQLLPETKQAFDDRNRRILANTGALALQLYAAQFEPNADFVVHHPVLQQHKNFDYAGTKNGGYISPVLFLELLGDEPSALKLAERLEIHPDVARHVEKGQSFGFDTARILHSQDAPVVRIAGGAYTDVEALGAGLYEAILNK